MKIVSTYFNNKIIKRGLIILVSVILLFLFFDFLFTFKTQKSFSTIIKDSEGKVVHAFLSDDDKWRMETELSEITPILRKTIINKEDKYFYYHFGVNPFALVRAAFNNLMYQRKTSGASTITMQVARLVEPRQRTYLSKSIEFFRAIQLEIHFSKEEILQMYLNYVPYGSNIEGVKAASIIYYKQNPNYLSLAQVVALSIIPNRPSSLVPGKNNDELLRARNKWLKYFASQKLFPKSDIDDALQEPLAMERNSVPKLIPHLALRLKKLYPSLTIINSCLNSNKQDQIQNLTYSYVKSLRNKNISNAAVILINNKTNQVEAYVGSSDFFNKEFSGQVDGVQSIRSPGSTLKPFIYAMAFDQGIITPKTMLNDVPVNYAGYNPKNYDNEYHGQLSAETALSRSLNVPAVELLNEVGVDNFINRLSNDGFSTIKFNRKKLGLSVILGGCGVTLEELTRAYTCFSHDGKISPLQWIKNLKKSSLSISACSAEASFLINNTLTQLIRPDLPNNYQSSYHLPKIAWKTGTSYGRRDAWSIGYNADYTIGVWVGNFNGEGAPDLSGADVATPLLFDIFNSISYNSSNSWFKEPNGIDFRTICTKSGLPSNEFCTDNSIDYFIPGVSSNQKCNHLKEIMVNNDESISYCRDCVPENGCKKKLYPNYSPELITFFDSQMIPYEKIPEHNLKCTKIQNGLLPKIISPLADTEYIFENDGSNEIALSCQAANDVKKIYWYINDAFYKSCKADEKIFYKTKVAGEYKISCADDKGRNATVYFTLTIL